MRLATLLTGAVMLLLASCGKAPTPQDAGRGAASGAAVATPPAAVVLATAEEQIISTPVEAVVTAMARESIDVTAKVSNTISRIAFSEGQQVARGDLLVELDPTEVAAELAGAEGRLDETRRQFERSRDLAARKLLSDAQLDQIESAMKSAASAAAAARARRANTVIRAPFAGRTGFRKVSLGGLVNPGTVITTLDDTSVIKLEFTVPESQMYLMETGLPVEARAVGLPGRTFKGVLSTIDARIDPVSRSLRVRADLPNDDGTLKPGMFMNVTLSGRAVRAVVVPEAAIVPEQGKVFVYVVGGDGTATRREVQIGRRRPGDVEVAAGIKAGESVVVEGTQAVRDGGKVRPVPAEGLARATG